METELKGKTLTVKMELGEGKISHSGKTMLVYTTKGFVKVPNTEYQISINVTGKK